MEKTREMMIREEKDMLRVGVGVRQLRVAGAKNADGTIYTGIDGVLRVSGVGFAVEM